ncbi:MAG: 16S rRNA (uracil(1498)-N(3))-methyltransferase [Campylobacteraceae bacterium]|nr:16S rRNA (uracil(1498)-N(3))-methyltransferase [Campylobacteraceae bacterium]
MQFVYHHDAGLEQLCLDIKAYDHLFKVRRLGVGSVMAWRNLEDDYLYEYEIISLGKKEAILELVSKKEHRVVASPSLHVGWCVIDPKIIEKTMSMLNELGVWKISFVYAEFSQKQYKIDEERIKRILINSSQQCGRSTMMKIEIVESIKTYMECYPQSAILDFCDRKIGDKSTISSILIGPEGGFSQKERSLLKENEAYGLVCPTILRSETAVVALASKILL